MIPGAQCVAVPVLSLRGVLQVEEGVRGPPAEQARPQGRRQRRQAQVKKGDAGAQQGEYKRALKSSMYTVNYQGLARLQRSPLET